MSARNAHSDLLSYGSASTTTSLSSDTQYSNTPQFKVFISHAGDDKANIAIPLRDLLAKQSITAFVDDCDILRGTDTNSAIMRAMNTVRIAVIVLSPEFVTREWPIKELMHFLKRYEKCRTSGRERPAIIPCFYCLSITEMYGEPNLDRVDKDGNNLYDKSRFLERRANGDREADPDAIKQALATLHGFMGIENFVGANNYSSHLMRQRRDVLLNELCREVCKAAERTKNGPMKDQERSKSYSKRNAEDAAELNRRANLLTHGADGVERNAKEAVELYRRAIEGGNVRSMNNLANLLKNGADGVKRNAKEAVELYRRAIEGGSVEARNNLANLLIHGADGVD